MGSKSDVAAFALFLVALVALSFVAGAYVFFRGLPPERLLNRAFLAAHALKEQLVDKPSLEELLARRRVKDSRTGVQTCDVAAMQPGLTLFTASDAPQVYLARADGKITYRWAIPPSIITGLAEPDPFTYLRKAHLYPNGDILTFFEKVDTTPGGIAMVRVNADGKLLWKLERPFHHAFDVAPDGKIYALDTDVVQEMPGLGRRLLPMLDDVVVVVSPEGEELRRVSLMRALLDSPWPDLISLLDTREKGDHMHTNSVVFVTPELAKAFPFLQAGQVVVSIRQGDMIAAVDLDTGRMTWAVHGYWFRQHDVELLPNGHFLLFDNRGNLSGPGRSRVLEVDPATMATVWSYGGTADEPLESEVRSAQARLANGNTLITESDKGRLLEVTAEGRIVWDYRWPVRDAADPLLTPVVSWASRIDPASLDPAFRVRVDLGPVDSPCLAK